MDTQRIIALIVFSASSLFLWEAWQKHNRPSLPPTNPISVQAATTGTAKDGTVPSSTIKPVNAPATSSTTVSPADAPVADAPTSAQRVTVRTDTLNVELDTQGGDIRMVTLLKHPARGDEIGRAHV